MTVASKFASFPEVLDLFVVVVFQLLHVSFPSPLWTENGRAVGMFVAGSLCFCSVKLGVTCGQVGSQVHYRPG